MKKLFILILLVVSLVFSQSAETLYDMVIDGDVSQSSYVLPILADATDFTTVIYASNKTVYAQINVAIDKRCVITFYGDSFIEVASQTNSKGVYNLFLGKKDYTYSHVYTLANVMTNGSAVYNNVTASAVSLFPSSVVIPYGSKCVLSVSNVSGSVLTNMAVVIKLFR